MTTEIKLKSLVAKQLGIVPEAISDNADLVKNLGADSLDLLEIVMGVEKEFSVSIEDSEYIDATSIDKIATLIDSKSSKN